MTAPILVPTNAPRQLLLAALALGTAKFMVATDTFVPDQDTLVFVDDITDEGAGTGYPAGGITMTGVTADIDTATNTVTLVGDDVAPAGLSVSCRWGFIIIDTGTDATSPVLALVDLSEGLGGNITFTGIEWDAAGITPYLVAA